LFDPTQPLMTDPGQPEGYAWSPSVEPGVYYSWTQQVSDAVQFHATQAPTTVDLGRGIVLTVYRGPVKQELLYRIRFPVVPSRLLARPPYCLFWSHGTDGGASASIKWHYRDRFLSIHEWTDRDSFLAVLRQHHYKPNDALFWSR